MTVSATTLFVIGSRQDMPRKDFALLAAYNTTALAFAGGDWGQVGTAALHSSVAGYCVGTEDNGDHALREILQPYAAYIGAGHLLGDMAATRLRRRLGSMTRKNTLGAEYA